MLISSPCVVSLTWLLEDAQGQLIDELTEPVEFYVGGDDLLTKVEEAIAGQQAGFEIKLHLEPEHAFGEYDPDLVFFEERSLFDDKLEAGLQFEGPPPGAKTPGLAADAIYTVTEVYLNHVVLDGNHPLAGIALRLALKVHSVREASEEEAETGSVSDGVVSVLATAPGSSQLH